MPLEDEQIIFAPGIGTHNGKFDSVLFVVDSLVIPIYDLILPVFKEADKLGLSSVSAPTIRTGLTAEICESQTEAIECLAQAVIDIITKSNPVNLQKINVVVYNNPSILRQLQNQLKESST
jgi:hypothetical protein